MTTDTGRSPSGRACGPSDLSQSSLSQPEALVPNAAMTDAQFLRERAEDISRYEEDAQRLRRIAKHLDGGVTRITPQQAQRRWPKLMAQLSALAAGSRRAKTPQAVECKASQSDPKGTPK